MFHNVKIKFNTAEMPRLTNGPLRDVYSWTNKNYQPYGKLSFLCQDLKTELKVKAKWSPVTFFFFFFITFTLMPNSYKD